MTGKISIGTAWIEAAAFLRQERRLLPPVVLGLILLPVLVSTMITPQVPPGTSPPPGSWMLVAFAMILVMMVGQMAIVVMIDGWRGNIGEAIGRGLRRLPTLVLAGLMVIVPLVVLFSVVLAMIGLTSGGAALRLNPVGWLAVLLFGAIALFITVRLLPMIAVVARGSDGPIAAIKRTFAMTKGQFWRLLGFFLLLVIGFLVAAGAVGAVIGSMVVVALGRPEPWSVSLLLIALAGALVQAGFVTVYTAMLARITSQLEGSTNGI